MSAAPVHAAKILIDLSLDFSDLVLRPLSQDRVIARIDGQDSGAIGRQRLVEVAQSVAGLLKLLVVFDHSSILKMPFVSSGCKGAKGPRFAASFAIASRISDLLVSP